MANITTPENPGFPEVYLIEENDDVLGGEGGTANRQAKEIVERTAFLKKAIEKLIADLGGDLNSATAVISSLAQKANLASPVFTGTPIVPSKSTAASSSHPTHIATEAQVAFKANIASPNFSGTPTIDSNPIAAVSLASGVYETNYPVGSYILIIGSSASNGVVTRNQSISPGIGSGNPPMGYTLTGTEALTGTWRSCGISAISNGITLARRVA